MDDIEFLKIAQKDLDASKLLLSNNLNSQSLFSFQQAVEKTTKFMGLKMGVVKNDQLQKSIGHDVTKIFTKMSASLTNMYQDMYDTFGINVNESISNDIHVITNMKNLFLKEKNKVKFVSRNIREIYEESVLITEDDSICNFDRLNKYFIDYFNIDFLKGIKNEVEISYIKFRMNEEAGIIILKINWGEKILRMQLLLCLLFVEYDVNTLRYPDISNEYSPNEEFRSDNDYIKELPYFQEILQCTIILIPKIF